MEMEKVNNKERGDNGEVQKNPKKKKVLNSTVLAKFHEAHDKTGIIYLSRIPPFMKPSKVRQLLTPFGEIGRIYLAPEDTKVAARRKKYKGNKRSNYTEGWVEFLDKKIAKQVATTLNATKIGGKKRSYYHDDLWNIKYLPKFKWRHLTEQITYERAVRDQKLKAEMAQSARENKIYLRNVDKAKMIESIEERKGAKRTLSSSNDSNEDADTKETNDISSKTSNKSESKTDQGVTIASSIRRKFRQRKVIDHIDKLKVESSSSSLDSVDNSKKSRVLSKLFTS